jgi:hypothetical protein
MTLQATKGELMRRYGLYDATRGLMTALAVGVAGLLLWVATQVGMQTTGRFWASLGIVAAAGLVFALLPAMGSPVAGLRLRLSPGTFLLGFLPTLVVVGWILLATQPGSGWHEGRFSSWSQSIGVYGLVHALGLWHGVLAFGLGAVLGMSLDALPVPETVVERDTVVDRRRETTSPTWRRRATVDTVDPADEPVQAERERQAADEAELEREREAAARAEPRTVTVGPADRTDTRTTTTDPRV